MKDIQTFPRIKEIRRKCRKRRLRLCVLLVILILVLIFILAYFLNNRKITISQIKIEGTHTLDKDIIEKEIYKDISGKYLYLFSKSNFLIYPKQKIKDNLKSAFPRIESLSINLNNLNTLNIKIVERMGIFLYCGDSIPEKEIEVGENCYFVNKEGIIFDKAPYFSGNVYFKYYLALSSGNLNPLGKRIMDLDYFHKIVRFIDEIALFNFKPIYLEMKPGGTNYLYLEHGLHKSSPRIIFKNDNDLDVIIDNLSVSMIKKDFANEINSKYDMLSYIDLRFNNKILYKFEDNIIKSDTN